MLDLIVMVIVACLSFAVVGFSTPKYFVWGSVATGVLWLVYVILPSLRGATVLDMMIPRLLSIWTIYFRTLAEMPSMGIAEHGILGGVLYVVVCLGLAIPYIVGVLVGLVWWPELIILRWVF